MFILTQAKISLTSVEILTVQGMWNFFPPVNTGSLELRPAHNKPLKQFRPIIPIHCEQSFSISQLTINIGSPPSPIEIYGKTPSDFNRSCSRPWGFQRPDMRWFSILPTLTTGQTFGFVKYKGEKEWIFCLVDGEKYKPALEGTYNKKCYMESMNLLSLKINFIYSSHNKMQSI